VAWDDAAECERLLQLMWLALLLYMCAASPLMVSEGRMPLSSGGG
jgi:hypothetical protein